MKLKDALRSIGRLQALSLSLMASNILMAGGLAYAIVALNSEHERLVLIPPYLDEKVQVAWDSANTEYLKSFGLYVATLVGSIQPRSADAIIEAVSAFMTPKLYVEFRQRAKALINDPIYKASGAAMSFQPREIRYEPDTGRVFVLGSLLTVSAAGEESKEVIYEMGIQMKDGRPWVHHFTSYEGTKPRTLEWHLLRASREDRELPEHATPLKLRGDPLQGTGVDDDEDAASNRDSSQDETVTDPAKPPMAVAPMQEANAQ